MVIPWVGFPLADLLKRFEPTSQAKYVQFITLNDRTQMPGVRSCRARVALPRRPHDRRGDAPARVRRRRSIWQGAAEPERRAYAHRPPVEIRLQELQVDRPDPLHGHAAADELEHGGAAASTASTRTSTRRSITRAGARPRSGGSAAGCSLRAFRRRCSTATAIRSPASTRASTCARTTDRGSDAAGMT